MLPVEIVVVTDGGQSRLVAGPQRAYRAAADRAWPYAGRNFVQRAVNRLPLARIHGSHKALISC